MLCAHFSLCSVQFVARYSLRSWRALRARRARFAGPEGVPNLQCKLRQGGDSPPLKQGEMLTPSVQCKTLANLSIVAARLPIALIS